MSYEKRISRILMKGSVNIKDISREFTEDLVKFVKIFLNIIFVGLSQQQEQRLNTIFSYLAGLQKILHHYLRTVYEENLKLNFNTLDSFNNLSFKSGKTMFLLLNRARGPYEEIFVLTFKAYGPNAVRSMAPWMSEKVFPVWTEISVNKSFIVYLHNKIVNRWNFTE